MRRGAQSKAVPVGNGGGARGDHIAVPYAWREMPPRPSPYPRRRAAPSARAVTNVAAAAALTAGLLAFFVWPAVLGVAAMVCGGTGWYAAKDDDGAGGLLAAGGVVVGLLAIYRLV